MPSAAKYLESTSALSTSSKNTSFKKEFSTTKATNPSLQNTAQSSSFSKMPKLRKGSPSRSYPFAKLVTKTNKALKHLSLHKLKSGSLTSVINF